MTFRSFEFSYLKRGYRLARALEGKKQAVMPEINGTLINGYSLDDQVLVEALLRLHRQNQMIQLKI